ncbi:MAG TPA: hypothetical protein VK644_08240 [Chitinophagaceae bacterium]|nr:hypothetical protein [Chitinophagaceae bacterium]
MEENKFEKKVKQKMEELRLSPSGKVWDRIEEELQRKKKRRVVFFILSLTGLLLLSGAGYLISSKQLFSHESQVAVKNSPSLPAGSVGQAPSSATGQQPVSETVTANKRDNNGIGADAQNETTSPAIIGTPEPTSTDIATQAGGKDENKNKSKNVTAQVTTKSGYQATNQITDRPTDGKNTKDRGSVPLENDLTAVSPNPSTNKDTKQDKDAATRTINDEAAGGKTIPATQQPVSNDLPAKTQTGKADTLQVTAVNPETPPVVKKQGKKNTIRWELQLSGGVADQRTITTPEKALPPALTSPQNGPTNINGNIALNSPSPVRTGKAFGIGALAEWKITKRSSLKTGLKYQYLASSIKVGNYINSAISFNNAIGAVQLDALYRGVQQKTFHNRYHFIEVPIAYQLQLNKGKKVPILWESGVSLGYLISTNSLLYDEGLGGIYYHKTSLTNRLYTTLNTGFAFRFGSRNRVSWSLGPDFSWGLNGIGKEGYDKKQKFVYGGLVGRVQLRK